MEKIEDWIKKTTAKEDERFNKVKIAHIHKKEKKKRKRKTRDANDIVRSFVKFIVQLPLLYILVANLCDARENS